MKDLNQLVMDWGQYKSTSARFYRLERPHTQTFMYRRGQPGHPSNFAFVHFECMPSQTLSFITVATWPTQVTDDERQQVEDAIGYGIVEGLLARAFYPYRGCSLTLTRVKYDAVESSAAAFYFATKGAMDELIAKGSWQLA